ncbi:TPA: hypothetical protein M4K80_001957 [Salmonella enterica]|nr:hypothetical protein [Salmonella enterica]
MPVTSASTYARAFKAETNLCHAAGNYENKWATKLAKGLVGLLTLGIGYGIIRLIEYYHNVVPKIEEYRANAETIYNRLARAVVTGEQGVRVKFDETRFLQLEQVFDEDSHDPYVRISDRQHVEFVKGTFEDILIKLSADFEAAPGIYDVSDNYRSQTFFLGMSSRNMSHVINYSPATRKNMNLYTSNLESIYSALTHACTNDQPRVKVELYEDVEVEFSSYFNHDTGKNMVKVSNGERVIDLESTFEDLYQEMLFLHYLRDAAHLDTETFEGWVNKNKNSQGAVPTITKYSLESGSMAKAAENRLAEARRRFEATYGEDMPSERTPLLFKE